MSVARFIADQRTFYRVPHTFSCRALAVSEAWFYKWRDRPPTPRQARRALLDEAVREVFAASRASYGSPRVHADLTDTAVAHPELTDSTCTEAEEPLVLVACQEAGTDRADMPTDMPTDELAKELVEEPGDALSGSGAGSDALPGRDCEVTAATATVAWQVSVNTVADSMRRQGLVGRMVKRNRGLTRQDRTAPKFGDLLERDFTAAAMNQRWVGDMTEIPTDEGKLYLASVIDLCSRRLLAAPTAEHPNAQLACDAIRMAIAVRGGAAAVAGVIFHTDRGSTYTAGAFTTLCSGLEIRQSMGRVGSCFDNAAAESFFSTLEWEVLSRQRFATREQARHVISTWIEEFYNPTRRHSTLAMRSPIEHEQAAAAGALVEDEAA